MKFSSPQAVESAIWEMLLADWPRAKDRARINSLFNGAPPYTTREAEENLIATNVNDLSATKIDHDARRQFDNAFVVPEPLFSTNIDFGPSYKRLEWSNTVTRKINRIITNSEDYLDLREGVFGSVVLHGIGPAMWEDGYRWNQTELGVEDVLIPSNTLRSLQNLPFFAVYRKYTAPELFRLTHGPRVDKGWNMEVVKAAMKWVDNETRTLMGSTWPETWFPEKMEERYKQDAGMYASDAVPTIDTWHFFYYDDDKKSSGWRRRIILDAWGTPGLGSVSAYSPKPSKDKRKYEFGTNQFLYDSGSRVYATQRSQIIHFQFGDASAVRPARYHSIRSLGFLLYAVCHLQNRLKCKFSDAVFESLMQYFRVTNEADLQRVQKIDLIDKGVIPEGAQFVRQEERWKIDQALVSEALQMNRQTMADVSSSFTQDLDIGDEKKDARETATRTMAKVNATASLVGSMLNKAYAREKFRYIEICRRFCMENSKDPDVMKFRLEVLKDGVPEKALNVDRWEVQPNRVVGGGNKMMQVAIAEKLMAVRQAHGPEAQREILKFYDATITDDYAFAQELNPDAPHVSNTVHDTELAFSALMQGIKVSPKEGTNAIEVAETILRLMGDKVKLIEQSGNVGTPMDVYSLNLAAQYCSFFINQLKQDKDEKERARQYESVLTQIMNKVKGFQARQAEAAKQAQQQNGGMSPEDRQKLQFEQAKDAQKLKNQSASHAQRTAQRQLQFEQEEKRSEREHQRELRKDAQKHALEMATTAAAAANKNRMASVDSE